MLNVVLKTNFHDQLNQKRRNRKLKEMKCLIVDCLQVVGELLNIQQKYSFQYSAIMVLL